MIKKIFPLFILFMAMACLAVADEEEQKGFWADHLEGELITFSGRIEKNKSTNSLNLVIFDDYQAVKVNGERLTRVTITNVPGNVISKTRGYKYSTTKRDYSKTLVSHNIVEVKAKCHGERKKIEFPEFKFDSFSELEKRKP